MATRSGAINLTGLTFQKAAVAFDDGNIAAELGAIGIGPSPSSNIVVNWYSGVTGRLSLAPGQTTVAPNLEAKTLSGFMA